MKNKLIQGFRIPSLLLAAALQVLPIVRAALPVAESAANLFAVVFRWAAGVAAALGGVQAVSGASTVITNPLSTNIVEGRSFTLRLTTGPNQAHYWTATGLPSGLSLVGTNGSTFWEITGAPTVAGTFNVPLTAKDQANSGPSLTCTGTLVLNITAGTGPPVITTQPASQTAAAGQNVTFFVVAGGSSPFTYQWRFQSGNLSGQTASNLVLNAVTSANTGNYDVIVNNSGGSVTSAVATLTVGGAVTPPTITTQPQSRTNTAGDVASFSITVSSAAPVGYQWRKAGMSLVESGHFSGTASNVLSIVGVQTNDTGNYSVVITNNAGAVTSQVAGLTVLMPQGSLATMSLQVNGVGTVNPNYDGQLLRIGGSYTVTATPDTGYTFSSWTGGVTSTVASLTFTMESNLVLTANFAPVSYGAIQASYHGLFYESAGLSIFSSGAFRAVTTDRGAYSAAVTLLGKKYSFSGKFDSFGRATNTITRKPLNPLTIELAAGLSGSDQMLGRVTDGSWSADLIADRSVFNPLYDPAPQAGVYTLLLPGTPGDTQNPSGTGYGVVNVDGSGHVRFRGVLADGTKCVCATQISQAGDWPFYASFFSGEGSILGWLSLTNQPTDDIHGMLGWNRVPQPSVRSYPGGISVTIDTLGSKYLPVSAGGAGPNFTSALLSLADGNLAQPLSIPVSANEGSPFGYADDNGTTVRINPASGLISGRATDAAGVSSLVFKGAFLQKQNLGAGFFLGGTMSGRMQFGAEP